jgi:hypothetical protein
MRLSGLKKGTGKSFPLIDENNKHEYWDYLTKYNKSRDKADGLLHFVRDFYRGVKLHKPKMEKEITEVTVKIRETLSEMSDNLNKLMDTYKDYMIEMEDIISVVG